MTTFYVVAYGELVRAVFREQQPAEDFCRDRAIAKIWETEALTESEARQNFRYRNLIDGAKIVISKPMPQLN